MRCRRSSAWALVTAGLLWSGTVWADVPQTVNHQGLVQVDGVPFDGTGQFKFAILDASGVNVWTNDGTNLVLNGEPDTFEDVDVVAGVYSVILGGDGPGYSMTPIPPSVFNEADRRLRIWFDDGVNGIQQLSPEHALTSSPYGHNAANGALIGEVKMWAGPIATIPPGWRHCNGDELSRTTFALLFAAIGDIYGDGDQTTTFNLPDFRNRSPMGAVQDVSGAPMTNVQGGLVQSGGAATHTLTTSQIPPHSHSGTTATANAISYRLIHGTQCGIGTGTAGNHFTAWDGNCGFSDRSDNDWAGSVHTHNFTTGTNGGGGDAHNNVHPYFAIAYIIYTGVIE